VFISVIICTHNPRSDYFQRVLDALQAQTLPLNRWELLVVDNASKEPLAQRWKVGWHPGARHIREEEPGLTPARLRGIEESRGDILVFVDDDNILVPDFLEKVPVILERYPYLGVFGPGMLTPEFEVAPPPPLSPKLPMLALRCVPRAVWSNNIRDFECIPWGAGLCAMRPVAERYRQLVLQLDITSVLGRRRQQLFCGEDDVFSWAAVAGGRGFGIFPELRVTHLIPAGRLKQAYFIRLVHGHAFSHGVLEFLRDGARSPRLSLIQCLRILFHRMKYGLFTMRCEWAVIRGTRDANQFIFERHLQPLNILTTS
jgi:glycosyltransferase involved in cell wall biosynthesis